MRTGGGGRLLRGNLRRRQNRDCDDQAKTSGGAMHNLYRAIICLRKRRLVISLGHLGKTFHVHEPEGGGEWAPVCLRTMIGRVWDVSPNRVLERQSTFHRHGRRNASVAAMRVSNPDRSPFLNQSLRHSPNSNRLCFPIIGG